MDKEQFRQLTQHLIKYSHTQERDVLATSTTSKCEHCPKTVVNQLVVCEAHKLGTPTQHFKHKCMSCRMTVYDGSYAKQPRALRPFSNYVPKPATQVEKSTGPTLSRHGKVMGRPRKDSPARPRRDPNLPKRAIGRPRKNPQS